jgi:hypothetical protein
MDVLILSPLRKRVAKRSPKASTEITAFDREAKAVEMRAAGHSFQSISDELGYSDASGASKAYHRALARRPAQNVDQIRDQESERLEYMWRKVSEVIENPPLVHSAIGKTVPDPRPGREGLYLVDERAKVSAVSEYRHLSESYRKMNGVDLGGKAAIDPEIVGDMQAAWEWAQSLAPRVRELEYQVMTLEAENDHLRSELARYQSGEIVMADVVST